MGCFGGGDKTSQNMANQDQAAATGEQAALDKTLGYFSGSDPTQTGLYKTLYTGGIQSTNQAYNDAEAANKLHANVSGFGYSQPLAQAADEGVNIERAKQLSDVPREALLSTIGPELQAAGIREGLHGQDISGANNAEANYIKSQAMQGQLMSSLLGGALKIGTSFIPGVGPIAAAGMGAADQSVGDYLSPGGGAY